MTTPTLGVASATSLATSAASPLLMTNGQLVSVALTSQTVGATTLTIPDFASVVDEFTFKTKAQTMSNKTFVTPVLGTPASGVLTNCTGYVGTSTLVTTGVLTSGSIASGFGSINVGANSITGGAISGTTGGFTGDVTISSTALLILSGSNSQPLRFTGATTGASALNISNTGGSALFGQENSVGSNLIVGSTAYDTIIRGTSGIAFSANAGAAMQMRLSTTGLAVTGTVTNTYSGAGPGVAITNSSDTSGTNFLDFKKAIGTTIGSITRVTTTDAVAYNTTSDARLKTNVRDFTAADSGRIIDGLRPRWFDWKNSGPDGIGIVGFIAQEEHAVDPVLARIGAVTVGDDNPYTVTKQWAVDSGKLVPILVAEIKSLRARLAIIDGRN